MKKCTLSMLVTMFLVTLSINLFAQSEVIQPTGVPYATPNSVLYGSDVIIDNQFSQDQRHAKISVAFNGALYAGFSVNDGGAWKWMVYVSNDDGATWAVLREQLLGTDWYVQDFDLIVTGTTAPELRLFVVRALHNDVTPGSNLFISRLDAYNGSTISNIWSDLPSTGEKFMGVSIASDYLIPSDGASPYSIAVAYTKYQGSSDSVRLLTSSDGGVTIDGNELVTHTGNYVRKVSLSFGSCPNWFYGRYFLAWEERPSSSSDIGYIYASHTDGGFNYPCTVPYRLDDKIGATAGFARNPSISCQVSPNDNDMTSLTEVVLFDRAYNGNTSDFDVVGLFNKQAPNTDNWSIFGMAATSAMEVQPNISFDLGYDNFLATYANLTTQGLNYVVKQMNMADPYNWIPINTKYNDANNLVNPYPQVKINPVYTQVAHVWSGDVSGMGVATFDAEYSTIGVNENPVQLAMAVSPNPASTLATFRINLKEQTNLTLQVYTLQGKEILLLANGSYAPGVQSFSADVSALPEGCYIYRVTAGNKTGTGRLIVSH